MTSISSLLAGAGSLQNLFSRIDTNKNSSISSDEFLNAVSSTNVADNISIPADISKPQNYLPVTADPIYGILPIYTRPCQNLVTNGSFEADKVGTNQWGVYKNVTGWHTDMGDGIEIDNGNVCDIEASDGNQKVELDSNNNSNMWQNVPTKGTGEFTLSFDYSPRPGVDAASNPIEVYWDGKLLTSITGGQNGWSTHNFTVQGAGDMTHLEFRAVGANDSYGGLLDNVSVVAKGSGPVADNDPFDRILADITNLANDISEAVSGNNNYASASYNTTTISAYSTSITGDSVNTFSASYNQESWIFNLAELPDSSQNISNSDAGSANYDIGNVFDEAILNYIKALKSYGASQNNYANLGIDNKWLFSADS